MGKLFNLARVTTATTGTGNITLGSAVSGYLTFALAGAANGDIVSYAIKDGANSEIGEATYSSTGPALNGRTVTKSTNSNAAISLSGTAEVFITPRAEDLGFLSPPQGRLTLTPGASVPTVDVSGATMVFYTPACGLFVPIPDGSKLVMTSIGAELSQATTDTTKSPAACIGEACYDEFVWNDSGTIRCTRGPAYVNATTVTITIASPAVVSGASPLIYEGAPVIFTTSGALPTGITPGTPCYAGKSPAGGSFNIATSIANAAAGIYINTSGSQSGTHICTNHTTTRGTGAGTSELDFTTYPGMPVNKYDITNGPAAGRGLFVGTILTNASATVDMKFGTSAANGGTATLGVWNAYNQVLIKAQVQDSTSSWNYTSSTTRAVNGSVGNRINFVSGLAQQAINASNQNQVTLANVAGAWGAVGLALNKTNAPDIFALATNSAAVSNIFATPLAPLNYKAVSGANYVQAVELSDGTHATSYAASGAQLQGMFLM